MNQKYDIIGDIHGYATPLKALLAKLGYREQNGAYRHPERKVIFLGDFIDRGPEIREALRIVRTMVEGGSALAVMGNHEFNALAYVTPDGKGGFLREHTPEKAEQRRATMEQIGTPHPEEWKGWLKWFATLPLFLDLGQLRAVHAAWDPKAVKALAPIKRIDEATLRAMALRDGTLQRCREALLNGVEVTLPEGCFVPDKAGFKRNHIRVHWWKSLTGKTYRQAMFPSSDTVPDWRIPAAAMTKDLSYAASEPPVFFGHYSLPAETAREPLAPNVACLDYSVTGGGGMTAYRWDGESVLRSDKFVAVENKSQPPADGKRLPTYCLEACNH